jgi:hypothetical protein
MGEEIIKVMVKINEMKTTRKYKESVNPFLWADQQDWQTLSQTNQKKVGEDLN